MARPRTFEEPDVIAAAIDEFWSRGYCATSIDDLTSATGLGKGSLYGAFGDKHALFVRALDDYIASALDSVRAELNDPKRDAFDRLAQHIRTQAANVAADKMRRGCLAAKSAAELNDHDAQVARAIEQMMSTWQAELIHTITAAQQDGTIDRTRDPRALATTVLTFIRGLEALGKAGVKPAQLMVAADEMVALLPRG